MIVCTIVLKEEINGGVSVVMSPDQRDASKREMLMAGIIDKGISAAIKWMYEQQKEACSGPPVEGASKAVEEFCADYIRKHA